MNQPPNDPHAGMNTPSGYGPPPGYPPQSAPMPQSGSYQPQPGYGPPPMQHYPQAHGIRGMTRQMFNPAAYRQSGSGSWAASSLIISLVSFLFCGFLSPISLILGMVGLVGNKRAKGMAFAGVLLSLLQVGFWAIVMGAGMWQMMYTEEFAEQAGAPVVAAVEQFKEEHKRVPHSLDELVAGGYLPPSWDQGFDDVDSTVQGAVRGKKWGEFLRYKAGENPDWEGSGYDGPSVKISGDNWTIDFKDDATRKEHTTYGLVFCGVDGSWGGSDDAKVNQKPDKAFDLNTLWGGNEATRAAMKTQAELQRMMNQIDSKLKELAGSEQRAQASLSEQEDKLRTMMRDKNLRSLDDVKKDTNGNKRLKLVGETAALLKAVQNKQRQLMDKREGIEIEIDRMKNQVEWAKLAENKDELAKLTALLEESRETLEKEDSYFAGVTESQAADEWFNENFK